MQVEMHDAIDVMKDIVTMRERHDACEGFGQCQTEPGVLLIADMKNRAAVQPLGIVCDELYSPQQAVLS